MLGEAAAVSGALHMEILSHPKDKQKGKSENGLSLVGNAPSCPSSLSHSRDGRHHNVRVTGTSSCEWGPPVPQTVPLGLGVPSAGAAVTVGPSVGHQQLSNGGVCKSKEAPTLFVGSMWEGPSGMESVLPSVEP